MLNRRTVLKLVATVVPGLMVGCGRPFDPEAIPESDKRFPRTPIAGDMTSSRVVIAFFVADDSPVTLRMWTGEDVVVDREMKPTGDGFHKVQIDDLPAGTTFQYAVFGGKAPNFDNRSLIGQVRTAPSKDALEPVRIALLACVGQGTIIPDFYLPPQMSLPTQEPFQWPLFQGVADLDLDLDALVHLGDQAYLDFVWSEQEGTVPAYLEAWGYYHGGGYRDLYPLAGLYASWDDHESSDNSAFDPWDMTPEEQTKLANAQEAWFKVMPIDATKPGPIWRGFRWGATLELLILDCRYELTPDQLVSAAQLEWLMDRISASPCRFVCVATPKPFAKITSTTPFPGDNADRWDGHLSDRDRLAALLDDGDHRHVMFVAGDIHMTYLGRASETGESPSERAWEVCCTSGNINPVADGLSPQQFAFAAKAPHLPVLDFDPGTGTVHVAFYDMNGAVAFEQTLDDLG